MCNPPRGGSHACVHVPIARFGFLIQMMSKHNLVWIANPSLSSWYTHFVFSNPSYAKKATIR
jgi:hypothetical protein